MESERVAAGSREIHLRPNSDCTRVVTQNADVRVIYRERQYGIGESKY